MDLLLESQIIPVSTSRNCGGFSVDGSDLETMIRRTNDGFLLFAAGVTTSTSTSTTVAVDRTACRRG